MQITDEMVEAAARAAFEAQRGGFGAEVSWEAVAKEPWRQVARAVFRAVSPTQAVAVKGLEWRHIELLEEALGWIPDPADAHPNDRTRLRDLAKEIRTAISDGRAALVATPPDGFALVNRETYMRFTGLAERVRELEEALRPFADLASCFHCTTSDKWIVEGAWKEGVFKEMRVGHFRRAARAMEGKSDG